MSTLTTKLVDRALLRLDATGTHWWLPWTRTAEARFRDHNARNRQGNCPCGKPVAVLSSVTPVTGRVPYEHWTCKECKGATGWDGRGRPHWG